MRLVPTPAALSLAAALLLGCEAQNPTSPAVPDPVQAKVSGGAGQASYSVQFGGDIASDPFAATLSANDPFQSVSLNSVTLSFVATSGIGCLNTVAGWGLYVGKNWTGSLTIKKRAGSNSHLGFVGTSADGGWINLAINNATTQNTVGNVTTLTFANATAYIGAGSSPSGTSGADAGDRCVSFTITATRL